MKLPFRKPLRNQKGVVLIWMATLILAMLAFVSLSIDVAKLLATKTQLQNAADAAALAGASALNETTGYLDPTLATTRATAMALQNKAFIGGEAPVDGAEVVMLDSTGVPSTTIATDCQVTVRRQGVNQITLYLAQIVKLGAHPVAATATAHRAQGPTCLDVVPIGFNSLVPQPLVTGETYVVSEGIGTGNYQFLSLPPCTEGEAPPCAGGGGADLLRCQIEHGYGCCVELDGVYDVKTGVNAGPVKQAIDARFERDRVDTEYPLAQLNSYLQYKAANGSGDRVVHIPIMEFSGGSGGTMTATVKSFAAFFLKRRYEGSSGHKFYGEFVRAIGQGEGEGGGGSSYTLRLTK